MLIINIRKGRNVQNKTIVNYTKEENDILLALRIYNTFTGQTRK